jgi:Fe-S oxidoreductase
MGDEYTFQALAKQNIETFGSAGITKIVTTCPHCFNTIANEYRDFGGEYQVVHHTELLAQLVAEGRLKPQASDEAITYHDSCYLARHNDVREAPRAIVSAVGRPLEMARREERTFCCGAGGAHMWLEERGNQINEERAREAAATGATTLAVACPFCTVMLDDGMQTVGGGLAVKDVATLLVEAVERGQERPPAPLAVPAGVAVRATPNAAEGGRAEA